MPIDRNKLDEQQPKIPEQLKEDQSDFLPIINPDFFLLGYGQIHDSSQLKTWLESSNSSNTTKLSKLTKTTIQSNETTEDFTLLHHCSKPNKYLISCLKIIELLILRSLSTTIEQAKEVASARTSLADFNQHESAQVFVREALLGMILFAGYEDDWPSVVNWLRDKTKDDRSLTGKAILDAICSAYTNLNDITSKNDSDYINEIPGRSTESILKLDRSNYIQSIASEEAKEPHKNKEIISDYVQSFLLLACITQARKNELSLTPRACASHLLQFFKPWFTGYIAAAHCGCFKTFRRFWLLRSCHDDLRESLTRVLNSGENAITISFGQSNVIVSPAASSKIK